MAIMYVLVLPLGGLSRLLYRIACSTMVFDFSAQLLAMVPGVVGLCVRACFYHQALDVSHFDVVFGFGTIVSKPGARIGRGVFISKYSSIGLVDLGDGAVIAGYVSVLSGKRQHNLDDPTQPILDGHDRFTRVTIGHDVFVGEHATIMADVGDRSIVGAGSVVVNDVPGYVVVAGNPAQIIKHRIDAVETAASEEDLSELLTGAPRNRRLQ